MSLLGEREKIPAGKVSEVTGLPVLLFKPPGFKGRVKGKLVSSVA